MKITLTHKEAEDIFHTSLCNTEAGSYLQTHGLELTWDYYWYDLARKRLQSPCIEDILMEILKINGPLHIIDHEGDEENNRTIYLEDVYKNITKVPLNSLENIISENDDVIDADAVLQTIFYTEVIFN